MNVARDYSIYPEPEGLIFTEGWCTDLEKDAIALSVARVATIEDGGYYEIGCFEGRSTVFTANLIFPHQLIAIDPWFPVDYAPYEVKVYAERPIKKHFEHNIANGTKGNVSAFEMKWEDYFAGITEPIKYLYLDGPHDYDNVIHSLEVLTPMFVEGGVMAGDDYDDPEVRRAVVDFFGKDMTHPKSGRTFEWVNGA